jgi:methyl-accepting chemotaxis protein
VKNLSLNIKMTFVISILSVSAICIGAVGLNKMAFIKGLMTEITGTLIKRNEIVSALRDQQRQIAIANKQIVIEKDKSKIEKLETGLISLREELGKIRDEYDKMASPEGKKLVVGYREAAEKWMDTNAEVRRLLQAGKDQEMSLYIERENEPARMKAVDYLDQMTKLTTDRLEAATEEAEASYNAARNLVLTVTILSLLTGGILAVVILRMVGKAIDQVIANLNDNSNQVSSASAQVAASSEELSQAATEQASSLEETASADFRAFSEFF